MVESLTQEDIPAIIIEAPGGWRPLRLAEVWANRDLLYLLAWRDIRVRYKQTILGLAWVLLQPLFSMVIFTLIFGRLAQIPKQPGYPEGIPYALFFITGQVLWTLFASGVSQSASSLVLSAGLLQKVYFPRLIAPLSCAGSILVDFCLSLLVVFGLMVHYNIVPHWGLIFLPLFVLWALLAGIGVGLWLAPLNVRFRDVGYTVPFIIQAWFFLTPVIYPLAMVPEPFRSLAGLNPMTGIAEGVRWCMLGTPLTDLNQLLLSAAVTLVVLTGGLYFFRRMEVSYADIV